MIAFIIYYGNRRLGQRLGRHKNAKQQPNGGNGKASRRRLIGGANKLSGCTETSMITEKRRLRRDGGTTSRAWPCGGPPVGGASGRRLRRRKVRLPFGQFGYFPRLPFPPPWLASLLAAWRLTVNTAMGGVPDATNNVVLE